MEDLIPCREALEFFGEGAIGCVALPAVFQRDEDEVSEVSVVVCVVPFTGSEEGARANSIDEKLEAFIYVVYVGGHNCQEFGDWGEGGNGVDGVLIA